MGGVVRPNVRSVSADPAKTERVRVLYYFTSTHDFQIGAPAVAGIGAPSVPSRRTRLRHMPALFGYMFYDNTEIDSESIEVTVGCSELQGTSRREQNNVFQRLKDRLFGLRRDRANPSGTPRAMREAATSQIALSMGS